MIQERYENTVAQAASGDLGAFECLVLRFQDMAVGYAFSVLGDFHLAQDAAQEAFVQAHRDLETLREPAAFPGGLRRLVFKHCDRITRKRRLTLVTLDAADREESATGGPADFAEANETQSVVWAALSELSDSDRQVLSLYYMGEYSQKEIADYLDAPVSTIKQRLFRSRSRLRRGLERNLEASLRNFRPSKHPGFKEDVMQTIAPDKAKDQDRIYRLLEARGQPGFDNWRRGRIAHSHFDWETSRLGSVGDHPVAVFGIYDLTMRIGTGRVGVAGANCDAIAEGYADREYDLRAQAGQASIEAMREQGYAFSLSFGEEEFYNSLGYVNGWRELAWTVSTKDLPSDTPGLQLEEFTPEHRDDLARIYNSENESLTGTAVRPTYLRNKHPGEFQGWLWRDDDGQPAWYVSGGADVWSTLSTSLTDDLDGGEITDGILGGLDGSPVRLSEYAVCLVERPGERWRIVDQRRNHLVVKDGTDLKVFGRARSYFWVDEVAGEPESVLTALATLAAESECEYVFFDRLHYRSGVGRRLRQLPSCRIEMGGLEHTRSYVVRIINLGLAFEGIAVELSRQLRDSHLANWSGTLLVSNGEEEVALAIDRSDVSVVQVQDSEHTISGGQTIVQLIVGTEAPEDLLALGDIKLTGDARELVEVLFPARHPQMENQAL